MSLSFHTPAIRAKEIERQELQADIDKHLQAGGQITLVAPSKTACNYAVIKSQKQLNDERKERKQLDGKPKKGKPLSIKTVAEVVKRNRSRANG